MHKAGVEEDYVYVMFLKSRSYDKKVNKRTLIVPPSSFPLV